MNNNRKKASRLQLTRKKRVGSRPGIISLRTLSKKSSKKKSNLLELENTEENPHLHQRLFHPLASESCPPAVTMANPWKAILGVPDLRQQDVIQFKVNRLNPDNKRTSFMGSNSLFLPASFTQGMVALINGKMTIVSQETAKALKRSNSKNSQGTKTMSRDLQILRRNSITSVTSKSSKIAKKQSKIHSVEENVFFLSTLYDVTVKNKELTVLFHEECASGVRLAEVQIKFDSAAKCEAWEKHIREQSEWVLKYVKSLNQGYMNQDPSKKKEGAEIMCEKYIRMQVDLSTVLFGTDATETMEALEFFITFLKHYSKDSSFWENLVENNKRPSLQDDIFSV